MTDLCYANPWPYSTLAYGGLWPRLPVEIRPGEAVTPPAPAGQPLTRDQRDYLRPLGSTVAGFCLPGLPPAPAGDYPVWRAMDADACMAINRAVITAPIREAGKSYDAREGTPDEWVKQVQADIDPLWDEFLAESLDSLSMGWKPFENVFARRDGRTAIADLKPLAQELSAVVTREGQFAGVRNSRGVNNQQVDLLDQAALVVACDQRNRDYYGRPWHENARQTWWSKLHVLADLAKLNRKSSGIQAKGYYPPASDEGEKHTNEKIMQSLLKRYMSGDGVVLPNAAGTLNQDLAADFRNIKGMAENALWAMILEDHGNMGPQAMALLEQLKYHNTDLSRAWHVPERASQEANTAGSRADSESHADISTAMAQLVFNGICDRLNRGPIDAMLVQNYGERARGAVKVKPAMLRDVYAVGDWILIEAFLQQPDLLFAIAEQIDVDSVFTRRGIPKTAAVLTLTAAIAEAKKAKAAEAKAAQQLNVPDVKPNGKANGQLAMARYTAQGAAWLGRLIDGANYD